MFKFFIYFILFASSYSMNNIDVDKLDIYNKNGTIFTSLDSFRKIKINLTKQDNSFILETDIGKILLIENKIITPYMEYTYISKPFIYQDKYYLPLKIILELSGASLEDNKIIESIEPIKPDYLLKKIISLSPGITEKIFALGGQDLLVGRTTFCKYPKEVENIDNVGTMFEPNLEIILEKKPDAVIAETHFKDKLISTLNSFDISTIKFETPTNIQEINESILKLGIVLDRHMEARALNASLKDKIDYTKYMLKDEKRPTVYYVIGSGKTDISAGGDTFISSLIELSGGDNIAKNKNGWRYSLEELILNDPDIIFGSKRNIENMLREENYYYLSAIKNKNYFTVNSDSIFNLPGPRALTDGVVEMTKIFHPEIDINLIKE